MGLKADYTEFTGKKPYFIQKGKIVKIEVFEKDGEKNYKDLNLKISFLVEPKNGQTFNQDVYVSANFKKIGDTVVDWGEAFKIKDVFKQLGTLELTDDNKIPDEALMGMIGKDLWYITYLNNEGKYRPFNRVGNSEKELLKIWNEAINGEYKPKNYCPDYVAPEKEDNQPDEEAPF